VYIYATDSKDEGDFGSMFIFNYRFLHVDTCNNLND